MILKKTFIYSVLFFGIFNSSVSQVKAMRHTPCLEPKKQLGDSQMQTGQIIENAKLVFFFFKSFIEKNIKDRELVTRLFKTLSLQDLPENRLPLLSDLNAVGQACFKRPDELERWQIREWAEGFVPFLNTSEKMEEFMGIFKSMRALDDVLPEKGKVFKLVFLNGATVPAMQQRIEFLKKLAGNGNINPETQFFFLTGERYLLSEEKQKLAEATGMTVQTEYDAAVVLWARAHLGDKLLFNNCLFVNAEQKKIEGLDGTVRYVRPSTGDTVMKLLEMPEWKAFLAKNPGVLEGLSVSSNPFVTYQRLVLQDVLNRTDETYVIIGCGSAPEVERWVDEPTKIGLLLDNLARTLYALHQLQLSSGSKTLK